MYRAMITLTIMLVLLSCSIAFAEGFPEESTWKNQSGSVLHIEDIDSEGKITGLYVNHESGYQCKDTPYPVTGWVLEGTNTITFTVKWENTHQNCQALASWTGFVSEDRKTITTLWQLVQNETNDSGQIRKGEDVFTRVTQEKYDSIIKKD